MTPRAFTSITIDIAPDAHGNACVTIQVGNRRSSLFGMFDPADALHLGTMLVTEATAAMQMRMGLVEGVTLQ